MREELSTGRRNALTRRHLILAGALSAAALPITSRAFAKAVTQPATQEDERLMRLAIAEAAKGDYPFGAVITSGGEVLATGCNLGKQEQDPTAHGEMVAIRRFLATLGPEKLKGTTLYTSGEPCAMCMGAIVWCGIGRLVYAASMDQLATKIEQIMVPSAEVAEKSPFATIAITGGVLAPEAMALFT
jgi:tRNA(Arg) A34 adenosine deaminase TadA